MSGNWAQTRIGEVMSSLDFCKDLMLLSVPPDLYTVIEKEAKKKGVSIRLFILSFLKEKLGS